MQWTYCWLTYLSPSMSDLIVMMLLAVVEVSRNRFWGKFSSLVIGMGTGMGGSTVTVRLSLRLGGQRGPWWWALTGDGSGRYLRSNQRPEGKSSELAQARDKPGMFLIIFPLYKEILYLFIYMDFPGGSDSKESAGNAVDPSSVPQLGRSSGGEHGNPLQDSCLENPCGQRSLASYSPWGHKESDMTEWLSTCMLNLSKCIFKYV